MKSIKSKRYISFLANYIFKDFILIGMITIVILFPLKLHGVINVTGTQAQRNQIANWLTSSLDATVTINSSGVMSIGSGGNASATRLRNMIQGSTSVTLDVVENVNNVFFGAWQSSTSNRKGPTTGTQKIDVGDLGQIGNILNSYGFTPDNVLMHEITEVYEGKKDTLSFEDAHKRGIDAQIELLGEHGTSFVGPRDIRIGDTIYHKIKRPPGSNPPFVLVKLEFSPFDIEWFKEVVPCKTDSGLIAIPDLDPRVFIYNYDSELNHNIIAVWDSVNSFPNGAAYDAAGNLYVVESYLGGFGEIRVFNRNGQMIDTIKSYELRSPEGIDIDKNTGDIFVAVTNKVIKFNADGQYLGDYSVQGSVLQPTGVAVWRNKPIWGIHGNGTEYDIYVTDKNSEQVFRFDVANNLNNGQFKQVFGQGHLLEPEDISIDSWWSVWVVSTGNHRIYRFAPNGELEPFGERNYFVEDTSRVFTDAEMVDFDGVYVIDGKTGAGAMLLYDYDGNLVRTYGTNTLQCPASIAINLFVNHNNMVSIPPPVKIRKKKGMSIPDKFELYQNYPNPFNSNTIIRFDIHKSSHSKLIVYNILGEEITILVNEKLNAGSYEVDWDASDYPSGVYFYKLIAGDFVDVKKMVLLK
ncbi:MAG: T9SS type A sorting domain-containing protein [Ignavibacteria bacterium]|nr:T9SS type A sorting domain-containing protein [Ignavibacteria bacterium]